MTPAQYQAVKAKLGLPHPKLAAKLGVSPRTSIRYAMGTSRIPEAIARALVQIAGGKLKRAEVGL